MCPPPPALDRVKLGYLVEVLLVHPMAMAEAFIWFFADRGEMCLCSLVKSTHS